MRYLIFGLLLLSAFTPACAEPRANTGCYKDRFTGVGYTICIFDPATADIRLFHSSSAGAPYGEFADINRALSGAGEHLTFAMNGGMYHVNRSPVGSYIEAGRNLSPMNTNEGPGNFHMLPNGVFWLSESEYGGGRSAHVATTQYYNEGAHFVKYATQSGPMLVIDGELHPKFKKGSTSRRVRNAVGILADGRAAFVMSKRPVNFHDFASLFKDHLGSDSALYLDGVISRLYAPELGRHDEGAAMGPIIGVVEKVIAEPGE